MSSLVASRVHNIINSWLHYEGITAPQVLGDIEIAQSMQKDQQEASQQEEVKKHNSFMQQAIFFTIA